MALWDNYDDVTFGVVANAVGQHSVWPTTRPVPHGWSRRDFSGTHRTCLDEIDRRLAGAPPSAFGRAADDCHDGEGDGATDAVWTLEAETAALRGPTRAVVDTSITSLIRAQDLPADRPATFCGADRVTRGELFATSLAWARVLTEEGCGREVPVALLLPRGLYALTAILAVLEAGGAYVPLSVDDHPDRTRAILDGCGASIVVTTDELAESVRSGPAAVLTVSALEHRATASTAAPQGAASEDLAYIFYTSGTAGEPKGVEGTHRQLVNYALWCRAAFALRADETVFLSASLFFLGSLTTIFTPLLAGWPIVVVPDGASTDNLLELSRTTDGGLLKLTPTHLRMLTARGVPDTGLARQLMVGSEPLTVSRELRTWMGADPQRVVVNHYGLTETHGCFCHWLSGDEDVGSRAPIGRPIDNVEAYIVDRDGELVDVDDVGELLVGGPSLGRGYRHRPGLTAARWIPNPWGADGSMLLRTGDLARLGTDGVVTVLGRADRQVKVRGHRVEPAAVEEALRVSGHVKEALVLLRFDDGRVTLDAFLLRDGDADVEPASLKKELEKRFPPPWVPTRMAVLSEFPVNANGKVDRSALPEPVPVDPATPPEPESSRWSRTDLVVAATFCDVLEIEQIGLSDSFYELGGDSLTAVEVAARVGRALHRTVAAPSADAATVRRYARSLSAPAVATGDASAPRVT